MKVQSTKTCIKHQSASILFYNTRMITFASIDYFSIEGIPFVLIAICNIWMFQPIVSTLHELGHALPALLLTRGKVKVRVGEGKKFLFFSPYKLGKRFSIKISLKNPRVGYTQFEQQKKGSQFIVLLGGPLFTFLLTWQAGDLLFAHNLAGWAEVLLISWFCGNFLALLRSVIPTYLKPTGKFPRGAPSDGLQILTLLFGASSKENQ
jgi:hypothetical protein